MQAIFASCRYGAAYLHGETRSSVSDNYIHIPELFTSCRSSHFHCIEKCRYRNVGTHTFGNCPTQSDEGAVITMLKVNAHTSSCSIRCSTAGMFGWRLSRVIFLTVVCHHTACLRGFSLKTYLSSASYSNPGHAAITNGDVRISITTTLLHFWKHAIKMFARHRAIYQRYHGVGSLAILLVKSVVWSFGKLNHRVYLNQLKIRHGNWSMQRSYLGKFVIPFILGRCPCVLHANLTYTLSCKNIEAIMYIKPCHLLPE